MGFNTSTNMMLPIPQVGNEPGPTYAQDINNCLTLVDQHDHSAGSGVQITPAGLNINSSLAFNNNNLITIRSARFQAQPSALALASDLDCLYVTGVDLYYNDGSGNQVRITQSGGVAGTPGSISGLASPASASYSSGSQTFIWQSAASTPANMDAASYIFRNLTSGSFGLTLSPPNAMAGDYTVTLPSVPAQTNILTMNTSGTIAAVLNVDNTSLQITSNSIGVKAQGITQAMLAPRSTGTTVAAGGVAISASCGAFSSSSTSIVPVTNLSVTITTTGRPIWVGLISDGQGTLNNESYISANGSASAAPLSIFYIYNGSTQIFSYIIDNNGVFSATVAVPASCVQGIDIQAAGTYTYTCQVTTAPRDPGGISTTVANSKLVAYEL